MKPAIALHPATSDDFPIIQNLVRYYIHDMSEFMLWPCEPDGIFIGCQPLHTYWSEPGKYAFVLRSADELAGFALVRGNTEDPEIDYSIAEFFVLRKFRRQGLGESIACQLFDRFRGRWKVEQLSLNLPAVAFWRKVVGRYTGNNFEQRVGRSQWGDKNLLLFRNDLEKTH